MRLITFSILTLGVSGYVPRVAEWSANINSHIQRSLPDSHLKSRDIPEAEVTSVEQLSYTIDVKLGNTTAKLLLDTGSFSTWTATPDFKCEHLFVNLTQETCGLVGLYDAATDPTAKPRPDLYFDVSYGSGSASGSAYETTVSVAGMEVDDFVIGYADDIDFDSGDGKASGIIGLGLGISKGFYYENATLGKTQLPGLFNSLKDKLDAFQFAITFGRGISNGPTDQSNTGILSFGGISADMGDFSESTFITMNISASNKRTDYSYWGGTIDGVIFDNSSGITPAPYEADVLVDSGTAYIILGARTYEKYNQLWEPSALYEDSGYFYIDCNATAPDLSIIIGGQYVNISSSDLIYRTENGTCRSAFVSGDNSPNDILGMPLFKSNVVVFDGDNNAMHFAPKP